MHAEDKEDTKATAFWRSGIFWCWVLCLLYCGVMISPLGDAALFLLAFLALPFIARGSTGLEVMPAAIVASMTTVMLTWYLSSKNRFINAVHVAVMWAASVASTTVAWNALDARF